MSATLIILAHPNPTSFSHAVAARISELRRGDVQVIDLYREKPISWLPDGANFEAQLSAYQAQVLAAKEIFFVFPCWWGDCPAIMRHWFDCVFSQGFAFGTDAKNPEGLLKGRRCHVIMSAGTPAWRYRLNGVARAMRRIWVTNRIAFCGMELGSFQLIGGMDQAGRNDAAALKRIAKAIS
ncbi:NAD(P)H-dependent oxidoreductase [Falsihalocynthiibacter sp. SS001]|uniref:NAD(P)H-dependent oxidoreductase n=1 Tax=Falsihalocynthiibacter sp. SS001 TaxID=3349698 RepID=UPI0036D365B4